MVEWFTGILVGCALGGLSGMGIGGGSLLLLWLTVMMGMPQDQARLINLMFFPPCALAVSYFRWRQGALDLKLAAWAIGAGCTGAILGNQWRSMLDMDILQKFLGGLFILCGIKELAYRPKKAK